MSDKRGRLLRSAGAYWWVVKALLQTCDEIRDRTGMGIVLAGGRGCRLAVDYVKDEYWLHTPPEMAA